MRSEQEIKNEIQKLLSLVKGKRGLGITTVLFITLIALEWVEGNPVAPSERALETLKKEGGLVNEN